MKTMTKAFTGALLPALAICSVASANSAWAPPSATLTCTGGVASSFNIQLEEFSFTTIESSSSSNAVSFRVKAQDLNLLSDALGRATLGTCTLATTLVDASGTVSLKWTMTNTILSRLTFRSDDTDKESHSGIFASLAFSSVIFAYTTP